MGPLPRHLVCRPGGHAPPPPAAQRSTSRYVGPTRTRRRIIQDPNGASDPLGRMSHPGASSIDKEAEVGYLNEGCGLTLFVSVLLAVTSAPGAGQNPPACPSCVDATALIERFDLREASNPVRERDGWTRPRKIVTMMGRGWGPALQEMAPDAEVVAVDDMESAMAALPGADVYIGFCRRGIAEAGTDLRWIHSPPAGAGACMSLPQVADGRTLLTNGQRIFAPQIADHAMGLLLVMTRRLARYQEQQRRGEWSHPTASPVVALDSAYWELEGKAMLVLGLGGIGTEVARRAAAFGMRVRGTRNSSREGPDFVEYVGLSDETIPLASWADVVVNALPLTSDTRGIVSEEFLRAMKPTAYLINVGRGETVDTDAMIRALEEGRLAGAGLDVTDPEPLPAGHPLWTAPNLVLTPHVAAASDQLATRSLLLAQENLRRYVAGEGMLSVVDPRRGY
jgi:phosphoglycerate dehydrogenase-like enzyme